jgi:hypothetical protein
VTDDSSAFLEQFIVTISRLLQLSDCVLLKRSDDDESEDEKYEREEEGGERW